MILIDHNGTRMLVSDLAGYDDATVLAQDCPCPPEGITADQLNDDGTVPIALLQSLKRAPVRELREATFQAGWTHTFSVGTATLDMRNADDKSNWTLLLIKTQGMVAQGGGALPVTIRTATNTAITIPASECFAAMQQFLAWGENVFKRKWELDNAINAATTQGELDAIDITVGWP